MNSRILERTVCGVGFKGVGPHLMSSPIGNIWRYMLNRCYNPKDERYCHYGGRGVVVSECWHNLQSFGKWSEELYVEGYQLDKDILSHGKDSCYSPENCCFIPALLNSTISSYPSGPAGLPRGVSLYKKNGVPNGRFVASGYKKVSGVNKKIHLGVFATQGEAFSAYKDFKEDYIKSIARDYYLSGSISHEVYKALLRWEVKPYVEF